MNGSNKSNQEDRRGSISRFSRAKDTVGKPHEDSSVPLSPIKSQFSDEVAKQLALHVGSNGLLRPECNLEEYSAVIKNEINQDQKALHLEIILASIDDRKDLAGRLIKCDALMTVLATWFSTVNSDHLLESIIIEKILDMLGRLRFSVDELVKYKFGRVIRKVIQVAEKHKQGKKTFNAALVQKAQVLFDEWNALAEESESSNTGKRSLDPPESSSTLLTQSEEKKTKVDVVDKSRKKKSVKFPEREDQLCKIVIFERAPEEYGFLSDGSGSAHEYMHADRDEASFAFNKLQSIRDDDEIVTLKIWKRPSKLQNTKPAGPEGAESEEKIIQQQRERTVLSATYFSLNDIPVCPSENDVDYLESPVDGKSVGLRDLGPITVRKVPFKTTPSIVVPASLLNIPSANVMASLFGTKFPENTSYFPLPEAVSISTSHSQEGHGYSAHPKSHHSSSKHSRIKCRHYRSGRPYSCELGSSCKFLHQD